MSTVLTVNTERRFGIGYFSHHQVHRLFWLILIKIAIILCSSDQTYSTIHGRSVFPGRSFILSTDSYLQLCPYFSDVLSSTTAGDFTDMVLNSLSIIFRIGLGQWFLNLDCELSLLWYYCQLFCFFGESIVIWYHYVLCEGSIGSSRGIFSFMSDVIISLSLSFLTFAITFHSSRYSWLFDVEMQLLEISWLSDSLHSRDIIPCKQVICTQQLYYYFYIFNQNVTFYFYCKAVNTQVKAVGVFQEIVVFMVPCSQFSNVHPRSAINLDRSEINFFQVYNFCKKFTYIF